MADIDRKNHEVESAQGDAKTKRPRTSTRTPPPPPPPPPPRSSPTFCLPGRCGTWARRSSRRTRRTRTGLVFRVRVADSLSKARLQIVVLSPHLPMQKSLNMTSRSSSTSTAPFGDGLSATSPGPSTPRTSRSVAFSRPRSVASSEKPAMCVSNAREDVRVDGWERRVSEGCRC